MEFQAPTAPHEPLLEVNGMPYFEHQEIAIRWMLNLETNGFAYNSTTIHGGILADDMGLGKTLEITGLIKNGGQFAHQTLIVAPLALLDNWIKMGHKAGFSVQVFGKRGWEKHGSPRPDQPQIYVVNYDKLLVESNHDAIIAYKWDRIVLDEAHRIRNYRTRLYKVCAKLHSNGGRWAVTGTPIVNSLNDAVVLFSFCGAPFSSFGWNDVKHIPLTAALVMHRTLDSLRSVVADAPPVHQLEKIVLPFMTAEEQEFYMGIQGAIKAEARALRYARHASANAAVLKLLLRLRQISVHPQIYRNAFAREMGTRSREWEHGCTKFEAVRSILQSDMETVKSDGEPHKYIFICHFREEIELLKEFLESEVGLETVVTFDGGMSQSKRADALETLKDADHEAAILIQLQAGGVGLNVQCCDRVFFLSPWWTAALMDQAIARAVRMGQREEVKVWQIVLQTEEDDSIRNIDRIMHAKADYKAELSHWFFNCASLTGVIREAVEEVGGDPNDLHNISERPVADVKMMHITTIA
jgi:transcription termination factor 2